MKRRDFLKLPALAALPLLPALPALAAPVAAAPFGLLFESAPCVNFSVPQHTVIHVSGDHLSSETVRRIFDKINGVGGGVLLG